MRRGAHWAAIGLALMALTTTAGAQDARIRLQHHRAAGDRWTVTSSSDMTIVFEQAGAVAEGSASEESTYQCILQKAEDGRFTITVAGKTTSRTDGLPGAPPEEERVRSPMTFVQDTAGQVVSARPAPFEPNPDDPFDLEAWVDYAFDQIAPLRVLPAGEVEAGDEWTGEQALKLPDGSEVLAKSTYRLVAYDAAFRRAYISEEFLAPLAIDINNGGIRASATGQVSVTSVDTFDVQAGRVTRGRGAMSMRLTVRIDAMGQEFSIRMMGLGTRNYSVQ